MPLTPATSHGATTAGYICSSMPEIKPSWSSTIKDRFSAFRIFWCLEVTVKATCAFLLHPLPLKHKKLNLWKPNKFWVTQFWETNFLDYKDLNFSVILHSRKKSRHYFQHVDKLIVNSLPILFRHKVLKNTFYKSVFFFFFANNKSSDKDKHTVNAFLLPSIPIHFCRFKTKTLKF